MTAPHKRGWFICRRGQLDPKAGFDTAADAWRYLLRRDIPHVIQRRQAIAKLKKAGYAVYYCKVVSDHGNNDSKLLRKVLRELDLLAMAETPYNVGVMLRDHVKKYRQEMIQIHQGEQEHEPGADTDHEPQAAAHRRNSRRSAALSSQGDGARSGEQAGDGERSAGELRSDEVV